MIHWAMILFLAYGGSVYLQDYDTKEHCAQALALAYPTIRRGTLICVPILQTGRVQHP